MSETEEAPGAAPTAPVAYETAIRLSHSDPAGIIYYPHYLDMIENALETWLADGLGVDYAALVLERGLGLPIAGVECQFLAPVRMGDTLRLTLRLERLEGSTLHLAVRGEADGIPRLAGSIAATLVDLASREPRPFPAELARRLDPARGTPVASS